MTLSKSLLQEIKKGKAILLLGSGALFGASLPERDIPLGNGLRDILCEEYLDDSFKAESLAHVSAMAISQSGLANVQDFIKSYFADLKPASFHLKIPLFKWRALFTTNYDRLLEICYETQPNKTLDLIPILSNKDNIDETRITNEKVPLVKLHGCITRTHDDELPLILTVDQYNDSFKTRERLFDYLYELAYDNTIIFVGHSLQDVNIRSVMLKLEREAPHGQRHYLIKPGINDIEKAFWAEKRISAIGITFEDFINEIDEDISNQERTLSLIRPNSAHPIQSYFIEHTLPSDELISFLTNDVEYITEQLLIKHQDPKDFYKGTDQGWFSVSEQLAITREIEKQIFENVFEKADADRNSNTEFFVIKGEAGSGKTVALRHLAWKAKESPLGVFLWVKQGCTADIELVEEITKKTNERVFIFWDDAALNAVEICRFINKAKQKQISVTVITAERYNEWNVRCEDLDVLVTDKFKLRYLSENEIGELLGKLDKYDCLGPNLMNKSFENRRKEFKEIHGRQLLVALHEATMGEPFEDIVYDEFSKIMPEDARSIYLTVCTLNRMKIPVRAGLISRIHDINFDQFKERFYSPLEKVVIIKGNDTHDVHYTARHSEIAEIVFKRAFTNTEDRYREYISIISRLNISFSSDKESFRSLIKAKALHELFPDYQDVMALYKHAQKSFGDEPYLLQQMANYERIRPNGSLDAAIDLLVSAKNQAPYDSSILHSLSVVWRDKANGCQDFHMRNKCRAESRAYLEQASRNWGESSYISASLLELLIDTLRDLLKNEDSTPKVIDDAIRKVQQLLTENKQKYPTDGHVHSLESTFSTLIKDHVGAIRAMEKAFEEKDREPYVAIRLAASYMEQDDYERAKNVLQLALERRRSDHRLNFHYAELLRSQSVFDPVELIYYYRRAFTPNDSNHQAQFWFARYAYTSTENGNYKLALETFENIRKIKLSHDNRNKIRDYDCENSAKKSHLGSVIKKRQGFGFIRVDGSGAEIFFPASFVEEELWDAIREGDRVNFNIGFSYSGPVACSVKV
jgi:cold shock CspA family protein